MLRADYPCCLEQSWGTKKILGGKELQNEIVMLGKIIRTLLYFLTLILGFRIVYILNYIWEGVDPNLFSLGASKGLNQALDTCSREL